MTGGGGSALRELARLYGVQTAYYDVDHRRRPAHDQSLLAVLRALGAPADSPAGLRDAVRERWLALWRRRLEPVSVAWEGRPGPVPLRLPRGAAEGPVFCRLDLEDGEERTWTVSGQGLDATGSAEFGGRRFVELALPLPDALPAGYHRLVVENGGETSEAVILSAPLRAFAAAGRRWGVFLPLYALRSREGWGAGDIGMMQALADWLAGLGGSVLATLPLLPAFLDEPFEPSPYAPVSRLWWNEFYIHAGQVPELARCPEARSAAASAAFQREAEELRESPMVDYRRTMALKRGVLEQVAGWFFESGDPARRAAFEAFAGARPEVQDYARFRAMAEGTGVPWRVWPEAARGGRLRDEDVDVTAMRYHMYVQWISHEQIHGLSRGARSRGVGLYLDLPLGVHADGYDTWRERGAFAEGVSTGAPPDTFFSRGQDWGFPPPHPDGIRAGGYRHLRAVLRHHLSVASILRVDHVMGLHRLYWIPAGMDPSEGVYVRYPSEEIYAALSIESHRHRALIAGEDLGTVPRYVPAAMARHGLHHTYVLQYEVGPDGVRPPPVRSVASLNTHDMPPFAAFWEGLDIEDHADLGLYTAESAARQRASRQAAKTALAAHLRRENWLGEGGGNARDVMTASLRMLAGNKAAVLVVNLEDMWLETRPQNVPGTSEERPNWRRKAWHTLEEIQAMPQVEGALRNVDRLRRPGVRR